MHKKTNYRNSKKPVVEWTWWCFYQNTTNMCLVYHWQSNKCSEKFPDEWEIAIIAPISVLSKVFEKARITKSIQLIILIIRNWKKNWPAPSIGSSINFVHISISIGQ